MAGPVELQHERGADSVIRALPQLGPGVIAAPAPDQTEEKLGGEMEELSCRGLR